MVASTERGFTVIEVMLFLAVTGALFTALMFGISASISQQRYRESVVSLSTLLQNEYNEVINTRNDRSNDYGCDANGSVANTDPTTAVFRGTSNCVLLGKIIEIKNGAVVDLLRVVGNAPIDPQDSSDIGLLQLYKPRVTDYDKDSVPMEWGSTIATTGTHHDLLNLNVLVLRSPASGLVRVFLSQSDPIATNTDVTGLISAAATSQKFSMCVFGDSVIAAKQSVTINPAIGGPDGISVNQADRESCG